MSTMAPEAPAQTPVAVGDFFVCSWGYDQTNIDFYKVVGMTPSGKSVKVQKWSSAIRGGHGGPQEYVVPGEGPATYIDWSATTPEMDYWEREDAKVEKPMPVMTKRLSVGSGHARDAFTVNSYSIAFRWDGKAEYQTGSGWGR